MDDVPEAAGPTLVAVTRCAYSRRRVTPEEAEGASAAVVVFAFHEIDIVRVALVSL